MLDRRRVHRVADPGEQRFPLAALVIEHADLDQLVRGKGNVDLVQHGRRQSVLADADEGMQVMRLGTERAALRGC